MNDLYDGMEVQSLGRRVIPFVKGDRTIQDIVSKEAQTIAKILGDGYHVGCKAEKYAAIVSEKLPKLAITVSAIRFNEGISSIDDVLQLSVGIEGAYSEERAERIIGKITTLLCYKPADTPAIPAGSFALI